MDSVISDSPLANLRPVFCHDEGSSIALEPRDEEASRGARLFAILLVLGFVAVVGYVVLSACADGSPLMWLESKLTGT